MLLQIITKIESDPKHVRKFVLSKFHNTKKAIINNLNAFDESNCPPSGQKLPQSHDSLLCKTSILLKRFRLCVVAVPEAKTVNVVFPERKGRI